jgi:hypothetical protein
VHENRRERRAYATRFANFNVIASGHEQIGRPRYLSTKAVESGRRRLRHAVEAIRLAPRECGADPIPPIGQTSRHRAHPLQSVQNAHQSGLGNSRQAVEFMQGRDRVILQCSQHLQTPFETPDPFHSSHGEAQDQVWQFPELCIPLREI